MSEQILKGQTAIITGASRGIGKATAIRLAKEGANVVIVYTSRADEAEKTADECRAFGVEALPVLCNVSDHADCERLFEEAKKITGRIEILVNNAGINRDALLMRMKEEDFDAVVKVNLYGTFNCMKAASKLMLRQRYGRIISISSIAGVRGNAGQVNYSASKAGIIGMTKSLAKELAAKNVTVNAIAPGLIETDMTKAMPEDALKKLADDIPAKRTGKPEDIAGVCAFLAGPDSAYITGQVISVDGGMGI